MKIIKEEQPAGPKPSREEAEEMIMQARLKAGWVSEADLAPQPVEGEVVEEGAPA